MTNIYWLKWDQNNIIWLNTGKTKNKKHLFFIKSIKMTISTEKFEILQRQKNELEAEYKDQPVFIDVHVEKLYIINNDWFKQFIF